MAAEREQVIRLHGRPDAGKTAISCDVVPLGRRIWRDAFESMHALFNDNRSREKIYVVDHANQASESANLAHSNIAIVGLLGRFPTVADHETFWALLKRNLDLHREISKERFDVVTQVDADEKRTNTKTIRYGWFIDEPGFFDSKLFNISLIEAAQTDAMKRLALVTAYEALEMSGYVKNGQGYAFTKIAFTFNKLLSGLKRSLLSLHKPSFIRRFLPLLFAHRVSAATEFGNSPIQSQLHANMPFDVNFWIKALGDARTVLIPVSTPLSPILHGTENPPRLLLFPPFFHSESTDKLISLTLDLNPAQTGYGPQHPAPYVLPRHQRCRSARAGG